MDSNLIGAHVLSMRRPQNVNQTISSPWIFGIELDHDLDGHIRWIVETGDEAVIAQLRSAYERKSHTDLSRSLFIDPLVNAVE